MFLNKVCLIGDASVFAAKVDDEKQIVTANAALTKYLIISFLPLVLKIYLIAGITKMSNNYQIKRVLKPKIII